MKIHLHQIPPDGLHIEGEESADILEISQENVRPIGPVSYSLDVGLSEGGLFATGNLHVDLELECGVCLEKFCYSLAISDFAMQTELEGSETVDLTPQVREDILLALPPYPHCNWNGEKRCAGVQVVDRDNPPKSADEAWSELEKLNIKKTK